MSQDYPDWTRLFHLVGTDITIPINIEASDVTLPVSIEASDVTLTVVVSGVYVPIYVMISSSLVTLDINIESQDANIDFNFADQSVAVFDAAKWFAHQAQQVFNYGSVNGAEGSWLTVVDYVVPANKVFYVIGVAFTGPMIDGAVYNTTLKMAIGVTIALAIGSGNGDSLPLDTPLRAIAGERVKLWVQYFAQTSPHLVTGSVWGYLEAV